MIPDGIRRWSRGAAVWILLGGLLHAAARAASPAAAGDLVYVGEGTLPIVISAPHGGSLPIPGVPVRTGEGRKHFTTLRDTGTAELAEKVAAALEKELGGKPFVVIARFHRKFADANRATADGCEEAGALPVHAAYHRALSNACSAVRARWGHGLLLDLHGQSTVSNAIIRGTANGRTVRTLVLVHGEPALSGPRSLLGGMAGRGYEVIPSGARQKEDTRYNGGFIVRTYGSDAPDGLDAIQLELGRSLRKTEALDRVAADLAAAIAVFHRAFLPPGQPPPRSSAGPQPSDS